MGFSPLSDLERLARLEERIARLEAEIADLQAPIDQARSDQIRHESALETLAITWSPDAMRNTRIRNCLYYADIKRVEDLRRYSDRELLRLKNFGQKCLRDVRAKLAELDDPPGAAAG
jgi:DNA-directed RNA polymerase alpha subunit